MKKFSPLHQLNLLYLSCEIVKICPIFKCCYKINRHSCNVLLTQALLIRIYPVAINTTINSQICRSVSQTESRRTGHVHKAIVISEKISSNRNLYMSIPVEAFMVPLFRGFTIIGLQLLVAKQS